MNTTRSPSEPTDETNDLARLVLDASSLSAVLKSGDDTAAGPSPFVDSKSPFFLLLEPKLRAEADSLKGGLATDG